MVLLMVLCTIMSLVSRTYSLGDTSNFLFLIDVTHFSFHWNTRELPDEKFRALASELWHQRLGFSSLASELWLQRFGFSSLASAFWLQLLGFSVLASDVFTLPPTYSAERTPSSPAPPMVWWGRTTRRPPQ